MIIQVLTRWTLREILTLTGAMHTLRRSRIYFVGHKHTTSPGRACQFWFWLLYTVSTKMDKHVCMLTALTVHMSCCDMIDVLCWFGAVPWMHGQLNYFIAFYTNVFLSVTYGHLCLVLLNLRVLHGDIWLWCICFYCLLAKLMWCWVIPLWFLLNLMWT